MEVIQTDQMSNKEVVEMLFPLESEENPEEAASLPVAGEARSEEFPDPHPEPSRDWKDPILP